MLILRRKKNEALILTCAEWPGEVRVLIASVETRMGRVKLGIDAPENVHIVREELLNRAEQGGMECSARAISTVDNADSSTRSKESHTTGNPVTVSTGDE